MGLISMIRRWINLLSKREAEDVFQINDITSPEMQTYIMRCVNIYRGFPHWLTDEIRTINFAKSVCSETARLATLAIGVHVDGSARANYLQGIIDDVYFKIREWVEYAGAHGTVIVKPNGDTVDVFTPDRFYVTSEQNGNIDGAVFIDNETVGDKFFTRLEYHRFEDEKYIITNKCYVSKSQNDIGRSIDIASTPWAGLLEEVSIENLERPLFGVLRMPQANNIDLDSPLGLPIFGEAIEELRDLDVAYSRNATEIDDSRKIILIDADRTLPAGGEKISNRNMDESLERMGMPKYFRALFGDGEKELYHEIVPELQTSERIVGINSLLSQIGYKCGYSNGYFVFNESSGVVTATQIEADQQRTIQLIKDVRDKLEDCIDGLLYALNAFADLYGLSPVGAYEITYDFGDITYNHNEERARWYSYVTQGKIPFWFYLSKFEGMSEEEAKKLEKKAEKTEPDGFEEE